MIDESAQAGIFLFILSFCLFVTASGLMPSEVISSAFVLKQLTDGVDFTFKKL